MCQKERTHSSNIYTLRTHCVLDTAVGAVGVRQFRMRNRMPSQQFLASWETSRPHMKKLEHHIPNEGMCNPPHQRLRDVGKGNGKRECESRWMGRSAVKGWPSGVTWLSPFWTYSYYGYRHQTGLRSNWAKVPALAGVVELISFHSLLSNYW